MTVEWDELADYLAGDLDAAREAELESLLFEDPNAAGVVAAFLELTAGIATIRRRHGSLSGILSEAVRDELRGHAELLEMVLEPDEVFSGHIPESVDICVAHLPVDLAGVDRADLEYVNAAGEVYAVCRDIPLEPGADRVMVACERHIALIEELTIFRIVAVESDGRRVLGSFAVRNEPPPA